MVKSSSKCSSNSTNREKPPIFNFKHHVLTVAITSFCGVASSQAFAQTAPGGDGGSASGPSVGVAGLGAGGGGSGGIGGINLSEIGGGGGGGGVSNGGNGGNGSTGTGGLGAVGSSAVDGSPGSLNSAGGGGSTKLVISSASGAVTTSQDITGGAGGDAGMLAPNILGAGGGGGGGVGVYGSPGSLLTNGPWIITGGAGGLGGAAAGAGDGGSGVFGDAINVVNNGRIIGGAGGVGGDTGGTSGAGGAGLSGAGLSLTNNLGATISGGVGGVGSGGALTSGAGGNGVSILSSLTTSILINDGSINGGAGSAGLYANFLGAGGAGVGGSNFALTNHLGATITGGSGGISLGGSGDGAGGAGVLGDNFSLVNSGSIIGGNAGGSASAGAGVSSSSLFSITNNAGATITGGSGGNGGAGVEVQTGGVLTTLTNLGSVTAGGTGTFGITNAGVITTLNNAQGGIASGGPAAQTALTFSGILPANYNIIINSPTYYGQLNYDPSSLPSTTIFGVATGSYVTQLLYTGVISGVNSGYFSDLLGSFGLANWSLLEEGSSGIWDLAFNRLPATDIAGAGTIYQSSDLGTSVNPIFDGGTLQVSSTGIIANNFTVNSNNGVIDQNGVASNFTGIISDAVSGTPGSIAITNTGSGGSVTFSGINTYTGSTTINSGATLALAGIGSIATSSGVTNNGTFDISNTTSGASVKAISGTGTTNLGTQTLAITNATGNLSGAVTGSGAINIAGGNQTLSGNNSGFTGGVSVQSGAALTIPAASALGTGTLALVGSSTVPATLNVTGTTTIANAITVAGDPVFNIATGTTTTVSSPIVNGGVGGNAPGDVVVAGGGTLDLTATNTYTGLTSVGAGSTLALAGSGSIANSSGVTNNGTFNIASKTGNVTVANYTQGSAGNLAMSFAPAANQRLNVSGAAVLAGGLALTATAGTYSAGKYTLLTSAGGVTGTFSSLNANLSNYTNLAYALSYDANDVYLSLFSNGPSTVNTQQSLVNTSQALQGTFTILNTALTNSFTYDCQVFDRNNICISAGGRNTAVSAYNGLNNTSALLIAAYRPHPNYRIGVYADQNLSTNNAGITVNLGNNTPLIGLFGAWNERLDGTGTEVKVSAAYGQKNSTVTRQVVGTGSGSSEAGSGGAPINSQGAQVTAKYGFGIMENVIVSPYIGMRYTQSNMNGYTESTSSSVTAPLTYSALNTNATTALAGVGAQYRYIPQATVFASAGVETDTNTANGTYAATGVSGLTPINFNINPVKTRPTATIGAYYDIAKNQRLGITGIYRQEPYQAVQSTTVMATYTVGL
ncbi:hypothetical protein A9236_01365 [Polynucleobacter sp. QLW-P1DATA-2]|nr:hypothetical protein A9236_01365 [Polynucleobacter sp. QLW-P1DATA-2]